MEKCPLKVLMQSLRVGVKLLCSDMRKLIIPLASVSQIL